MPHGTAANLAARGVSLGHILHFWTRRPPEVGLLAQACAGRKLGSRGTRGPGVKRPTSLLAPRELRPPHSVAFLNRSRYPRSCCLP